MNEHMLNLGNWMVFRLRHASFSPLCVCLSRQTFILVYETARSNRSSGSCFDRHANTNVLSKNSLQLMSVLHRNASILPQYLNKGISLLCWLCTRDFVIKQKMIKVLPFNLIFKSKHIYLQFANYKLKSAFIKYCLIIGIRCLACSAWWYPCCMFDLITVLNSTGVAQCNAQRILIICSLQSTSK